MTSPTLPPARLWPAALVLALGAAAVALVLAWPSETANRQGRVMTALGIGVLTCAALLGWWLLLSRVRWRTRFLGLGALGIAAGVSLVLFEFAGVTGDLVPILRFRFAHPAPDLLRDAADVERVAHVDHPTFLGNAERTAVHAAPGLVTDWESHPPERLWEREVGEGFAGFAVLGTRAVTMEQSGDRERVVAYDLDTGRALWTDAWEARYESPVAGVGPRATPSLAEGQVFALGATGELRALELDTGALLWRRRLTEDHACRVPEWGFSGSPLLVDDLVVVAPGAADGRSLAAYDRADGTLVWHAGDDGPGYAAPMLATLAGVRQIVTFHATSVSGRDPRDGARLWSHPWGGERPQCAQPLVVDERHLLVSTGYSVGACLIEVQRTDAGEFTAREVWRSIRLRSKFANVLYADRALYGLDDGTLACLDPRDGQRVWKDGRFGHGQLARLGDHLLVQTEEGELVLVAFDREGLRILTRVRPLEGRTWNPPAIAWPYVLVRHERRAVCLRFPASS